MAERNLDDIIAKLPESFRPAAARYGPALLAMTAEELWAWIELLVMGKTKDAFDRVVRKLTNTELAGAWDAVADKWDDAARKNAERMALQREAMLAILKVLLGISLALVGL